MALKTFAFYFASGPSPAFTVRSASLINLDRGSPSASAIRAGIPPAAN